ncbi:MAG: hypothetical protein PHV34_23075 [Verrucomicrobiae bacterium]|nr:hypothetical protein [Verrucomicrobiae bacterium]
MKFFSETEQAACLFRSGQSSFAIPHTTNPSGATHVQIHLKNKPVSLLIH